MPSSMTTASQGRPRRSPLRIDGDPVPAMAGTVQQRKAPPPL